MKENLPYIAIIALDFFCQNGYRWIPYSRPHLCSLEFANYVIFISSECNNLHSTIVYSRIIYMFISVNFICLKRHGFIVLSFTLHAVKCHPISSARESQQTRLLYRSGFQTYLIILNPSRVLCIAHAPVINPLLFIKRICLQKQGFIDLSWILEAVKCHAASSEIKMAAKLTPTYAILWNILIWNNWRI